MSDRGNDDGDSDDAGGWQASVGASLVLLLMLAGFVLWVVTSVKGR